MIKSISERIAEELAVRDAQVNAAFVGFIDRVDRIETAACVAPEQSADQSLIVEVKHLAADAEFVDVVELGGDVALEQIEIGLDRQAASDSV